MPQSFAFDCGQKRQSLAYFLDKHGKHHGHRRRAEIDRHVAGRYPKGAYSAIASPEPPNSAGKSFNFGRPSRIGSTVSA